MGSSLERAVDTTHSEEGPCVLQSLTGKIGTTVHWQSLKQVGHRVWSPFNCGLDCAGSVHLKSGHSDQHHLEPLGSAWLQVIPSSLFKRVTRCGDGGQREMRACFGWKNLRVPRRAKPGTGGGAMPSCSPPHVGRHVFCGGEYRMKNAASQVATACSPRSICAAPPAWEPLDGRIIATGHRRWFHKNGAGKARENNRKIDPCSAARPDSSKRLWTC